MAQPKAPDINMTSPTKNLSETNGKRFLQQAFRGQQRVLETQLEHAATSITHEGKRGDVTEKHFIDILRAYLPRRYAADSAIVIDSEGRTSDQIDVVIYDPQYTPSLLDQQDHKYVTAEAVYAVLEVKPTINKNYLAYAGDKAASVRRLTRTSVPFGTIDGPKKKVPFPITAGIVAARAVWKDGLGRAFLQSHAALAGKRKLDCVLALNDRSFDLFNPDGRETFSPGGNSLVFFLFRLLQRLQTLGTVAGVDWNAYAASLAAK
jgi:hypothetical protein